jgi:hypothetical protein
MPNKRSSRKRNQKFYCPKCEARLWRIGNPKYSLFCQGITEIQQGFNLSRKKASFLAAQEFAPVNRNTWLEEFLCSEHGKIWMRVTKSPDGLLTACQATDRDWKRTTRTIHPNLPNPSVSEYTYRHSRRNGSKKYYEPS